MHRPAYVSETFQARSSMGTPNSRPPTVKKKMFWLNGYEAVQGMYQMPEEGEWKEPEIRGWMDGAARLEVETRDRQRT